MVRATLSMKVQAGSEAAFETAWRAVAEQVRRVPGCLRQALSRDPDEPTSFVLTSDWESRDAFHRFERSPEQDDLTRPLRELRESARMTVHDLLAHIEGEARG